MSEPIKIVLALLLFLGSNIKHQSKIFKNNKTFGSKRNGFVLEKYLF